MMGKSMLEVVHETAKGWHKAGVMSDEQMHEFDALCKPSPARTRNAPTKPQTKAAAPAATAVSSDLAAGQAQHGRV